MAAVLLDAGAAPLWTSGLNHLELVEGGLGEPGSVGHAHYGEGKRSYTLEDRLVSVTPNRHYVSVITGGGLNARVETDLEATAEGTTMRVIWTGTGTRPLARILLPLMKNRISRQSQRDLEALRSLVESRWLNTIQ